MNVILGLASIVLVVFGIILGVFVGYLLLLTGAGWLAPKSIAVGRGLSQRRFLFVIPAYNEEELLPVLLASIHKQTYSIEHYAVHVVADNCTDDTAAIARRLGATVHERTDRAKPGKGFALQWLLSCIWQQNIEHDAVVILDADSVISQNFLTSMNAYLSSGARVIQAYYGVLDQTNSWAVGIRGAALSVIHYLRPRGRMALGASAGLKGNGMVFDRTILQQHEWSASVTEDIEYHMAIVLAGERVIFAPEAVVQAQMPGTLDNSETQNVRWEQGRLQMAVQYVPQLLRAGMTKVRQGRFQSAFVLLDAVMEHVIPPFSILAGLSVVYLLAALASGLSWAITVGILLVIGQSIYLFSGMLMTQTPYKVYFSLLYIPVFMVWKIWLYLRMVVGAEDQGWVRTARE